MPGTLERGYDRNRLRGSDRPEPVQHVREYLDPADYPRPGPVEVRRGRRPPRPARTAPPAATTSPGARSAPAAPPASAPAGTRTGRARAPPAAAATTAPTRTGSVCAPATPSTSVPPARGDLVRHPVPDRPHRVEPVQHDHPRPRADRRPPDTAASRRSASASAAAPPLQRRPVSAAEPWVDACREHLAERARLERDQPRAGVGDPDRCRHLRVRDRADVAQLLGEDQVGVSAASAASSSG